MLTGAAKAYRFSIEHLEGTRVFECQCDTHATGPSRPDVFKRCTGVDGCSEEAEQAHKGYWGIGVRNASSLLRVSSSMVRCTLGDAPSVMNRQLVSTGYSSRSFMPCGTIQSLKHKQCAEKQYA